MTLKAVSAFFLCKKKRKKKEKEKKALTLPVDAEHAWSITGMQVQKDRCANQILW